MEIKKLLFVTKFEEVCYDALQSVLNLKHASLNHVVFMTVIEREKVALQRGTGYRKNEEIKLRETANIRFIDWAESLFEQGMEAGVYIVVGSFVSQVIKALEKEEADLIVIGQSHKGFLEFLYSGSNVTELLHRSDTPVFVYKHLPDRIQSTDNPFDRPLLATDWSNASLKALEYIKNLNNIIKEVNIVHVADESELKTSDAMVVQETRKKYRSKLDELCASLEEKGIKARPHVYIGDPAEEIEKAAKGCNATMIVSGSSSKPALVERWLGSVSQKLAEKSKYSTLLVPPDRK